MDRAAGRRVAGLLALGLLPWVVVRSDGHVGLVLAWGLADPATGHVTTLPAYVGFSGGLAVSRHLLAWPVATALYAAAVASAAAGAVGREDGRVTGGLLVVAGADLLIVAAGVGRPAGVTALPTGTAALWAAAWVGWAEGLRALARPGSRERSE